MSAVRSALLGLLLFPAAIVQGICYLEDTSSECTVCWKTVYSSADDKSGFTTMAECPQGLSVRWLQQPPEEMFEGETYKSEYEVNIDLEKFPVVAKETKNDGLKEIPHANIHSCLRTRGSCTPFVSNSPGLATHTPALVEDVDDHGHTTFLSDVKLTEEGYVIIAHTRFFTPNTADPTLPPLKYDMAVGISRDVKKAVAAVSADSYVMAGGVGGMVLLVAGSLAYVAWKGILDVDKIMEILFGDTVTLACDIVGGLSDVLAFTIVIITAVQHSSDLIQILPICCFFCAIAWIGSIWAAYEDGLDLHRIFLEHYRHEQHLKAMAARHANDSFVRRASSSVNADGKASPIGRSSSALLSMAMGPDEETKTQVRKLSVEYEEKLNMESNLNVMYQFEMAKRAYARMRRTIMAMVTENIPIAVLATYIEVVGHSTIMTTLSLIFAVLILGVKITTLADYKQTRIRKDQAQSEFDAVFNTAELRQVTVVQVGGKENCSNGTSSASGSPSNVAFAELPRVTSTLPNPHITPVMPVLAEPTPRDSQGDKCCASVNAEMGWCEQPSGVTEVYARNSETLSNRLAELEASGVVVNE